MQVGTGTNIKLNTDKHHRYLAQGEYRYALNALPGEYQPFLSNDLSNKLCIELDGDLIGSIYIGDNNFVLFTTGPSIIKFDAKNCTKEYIIEKLQCLGFSSAYQITGRYRQDISCNDIYIYWIDNGLHNTRYLNINDKKFIDKIIEDQDCSLLSMQDCLTSIPTLDNFSVLDSGGSLLSGVYLFAVQLGINNNYTNWFIISKEHISITDDNFNSDFKDIDGAPPGTKTTKAIQLIISNLDTNYTQIKIAAIFTLEGVITAKLIAETTFANNNFTYIYTGTSLTDTNISLDEIVIPKNAILFPKNISTKDNVLMIANFSARKKINYQLQANDIKVNYYTKIIHIPDTKGYKNYIENYKNRSWLRDEVYALAIEWEFCDGTTSDAFPLIGREANEYDLELIDPLDPNKISCDLERWKNYNTAYRTEYFPECEKAIHKGTIQTFSKSCYECIVSIFEPVVKAKCPGQSVFYDGNVGLWRDNHFFYAITTTTTYNFAAGCWDVSTIWAKQVTYTLPGEYPEDNDPSWQIEKETTAYIKWFRVPIPNTDVVKDEADPCDQIDDYSCVYTRGELAYFEICEQYPIQYNCNGDLIYPCEKDANGDCLLDPEGKPIMKNIRYFKMPDTRLEPHYGVQGGFSASNPLIGRVEAYDNQERLTWRPYEGLYFMTLGLEFSGITLPSDIDPTIVKGYRILRVPRTGNNKTVIAKGVLTGTFLAEGDPDFAVPRHGVNSNEYYTDWGGGGLVLNKDNQKESYIPAYTFMSPNTNILSYDVNADYLKVEGQIYGKGRVYGDAAKDTTNDFKYWGRRQNINLNGFITDANSQELIGEPLFKPNEVNRLIRGIQFAYGNIVNINTANISYPLYNIFREASVYLELNKLPYEDPLSNKLLTLQYPNASGIYQSDEAGVNDVFFNDVDHSFYKAGFHCADYYLSGKDYLSLQALEDSDEDDDPIIGGGNCCDKDRPIPDFTANTWYTSIKRNVCNVYGNVNSLLFYHTGLINTDLANGLDFTAEKQDGTYGDSFINYWSYKRTSIPAFFDGDHYNTGDPNGKPNADWCNLNLGILDDAFTGSAFGPITLKTLIHSVVESDVNVDYRHEGSSVNFEVYYPKLAQGFISLDSSIPPGSAAERSYLNRFSVSDLEKPYVPLNWQDNYYAYNTDYSKSLDLKIVPSISQYYKDCNCETQYLTAMAYSEPQSVASNLDLWRSFLSNNILLLPTNTGEITDMIESNNTFYIRTADAMWKIFSNENRLKASGENIYIGSGNLFSQTPRPLYATIEGFAGSKYRFSSFTNQFGTFWIDDKAKILYQLGESGLKELSSLGMMYWFYDNLDFCLLKSLPDYPYIDNPANKEGIGFLMTFDNLYNRLILSKKDYEFLFPDQILGILPLDETQCVQGGFYYKDGRLVVITNASENCEYSFVSLLDNTYFCNKSWTISFSFNTGGWVSWHSYLPDYYINTRDKYFSFNNKPQIGNTGLWEHNIVCDYQTYYNIQYPHEIEYVINNKANTSIWQNLKYNTEAILCDKTYLNDFTYNQVLLYNSNQSSGWLNLQYDAGTYLRNYLPYPNVYVDRNERFFMINNFHDYTANNAYNALTMFKDNCGVCQKALLEFNQLYIDPIKDYRQLQKFRDTWIAVRFRLAPQNTVRLINDYLFFLNQNSPR